MCKLFTTWIAIRLDRLFQNAWIVYFKWAFSISPFLKRFFPRIGRAIPISFTVVFWWEVGKFILLSVLIVIMGLSQIRSLHVINATFPWNRAAMRGHLVLILTLRPIIYARSWVHVFLRTCAHTVMQTCSTGVWCFVMFEWKRCTEEFSFISTK